MNSQKPIGPLAPVCSSCPDHRTRPGQHIVLLAHHIQRPMSHTTKAWVNFRAGETGVVPERLGLQTLWLASPVCVVGLLRWVFSPGPDFYASEWPALLWLLASCDSSSSAAPLLAALSEPPRLVTAEGSKRQRRSFHKLGQVPFSDICSLDTVAAKTARRSSACSQGRAAAHIVPGRTMLFTGP